MGVDVRGQTPLAPQVVPGVLVAGQREARVEISTIKFLVAGVLQEVLDRAVQVHGALGVTDDTPLAFWYRQERAARIYDGPDEVHKGVVARRVLRGFGVEIK